MVNTAEVEDALTRAREQLNKNTREGKSIGIAILVGIILHFVEPRDDENLNRALDAVKAELRRFSSAELEAIDLLHPILPRDDETDGSRMDREARDRIRRLVVTVGEDVQKVSELPIAQALKRDLEVWSIMVEVLPEPMPNRSISVEILLYGPPGTGKTFTVKSFVKELQGIYAPKGKEVTYYECMESHIVSNKYGMTQSNMAMLFKEAKDHAPSLIFMDEIDNIVPDRSKTSRQSLLVEVLAGLNELAEHNKKEPYPVMFICASNLPGMLDPAFRRRVSPFYVDMPNIEECKLIFEHYCKNLVITDDQFTDLANTAHTKGLSASDIEREIRKAGRMVFTPNLLRDYRDHLEGFIIPPLTYDEILTTVGNARPSINPELLGTYTNVTF